MFYVISKLIGFFFVPSNLLLGLGLLGITLLPTRRAQAVSCERVADRRHRRAAGMGCTYAPA